MARLGRSYAARPYIATRGRVVAGTALATLGAVVASASGVRTTSGTASAALGGVAASAAGTRTDIGSAHAAIGGITAAAVSAPVISGTAQASLGGVTAAAAGVRKTPGTAVVPLGGVTAAATGVRVVVGSASAALGALTASATGTVTHVRTGTAAAALGGVTASAAGNVVVVRTGTAAAVLGAVSVTAAGVRVVPGTASAAIGGVLASAISKGLALTAWTPDARHPVANLPITTGVQWREEVSYPGSQSFNVPLANANTALTAERAVVKLSEQGQYKFACQVLAEQCHLAVDGIQWVNFADLPGLLNFLADGVIDPEYGLKRLSGVDRLFGFMSALGPWFVSDQWAPPFAAPYVNDPDPDHRHRHSDPSINKYHPDWIAPDPGPNVPVPAGRIACFRANANVTESGDYAVFTTGDDFLKLYLDGESIYESDRAIYFAWRAIQRIDVHLTVGQPLFAASVENRTGGVPAGGNVIGFVFVLIKLDSQGNPTGDPILVSNDTDWICTIDDVGFRRAQVLHQAVIECQARGAEGPSNLRLGFTPTHDSNGDAWDDDPDQYSFEAGKVTVLDAAEQLTESHMDVWVDPATIPPTLHAYRRQGTDRRSSVQLRLGDDNDGTLRSYETKKTVARQTSARVHLADSTWELVNNTAGIAAAGIIEVGLEYGSAVTAATARRLAQTQLGKTAQPAIEATAQPSSLEGAVAGEDYFLGDTITSPGHRDSGPAPHRVLGIAHDRSGDVPSDEPQFMKDGS